MQWRAVNPATGRTVREVDGMDSGDVGGLVEETVAAQREWEDTSFGGRAERLRAAGTLLRRREDRYARLISEEMGKPIAQARAEVSKSAWACEHYAEHGQRHLISQPVETPDVAGETYVAYRPLGVVLAIMPWNFPFWQVLRFAAPNLMAGNGAILKHAPNVPGAALAAEELFREAGFPKGLFRSAIVDLEGTGALVDHPDIRGVTLTGSVAAGRSVASRAGQALKKTVLELGGSDPYLILEDADLAHAVDVCARSRLMNSGQSCISAKRFIVVESRRAAFEDRLVQAFRDVTVGDPFEPDTDVGPLAREDLREEVHQQVRGSLEQGARLLLGGEIPEGPGFFYPPTVLSDVVAGMPAYDEEVFGPVASIIEVSDEAEAVRVANDSAFGLGAAVFTEDRERGRRIAERELVAGSCFVNAEVRSDPRLPFGGVKDSGYGRELALFGIREFVNVKTLRVD